MKKIGQPPKDPKDRKSERITVRAYPGSKRAIRAKYGSLQKGFDQWIKRLKILNRK